MDVEAVGRERTPGDGMGIMRMPLLARGTRRPDPCEVPCYNPGCRLCVIDACVACQVDGVQIRNRSVRGVEAWG